MTLRDSVRTVVVKTNPSWPFSHLNKVPYFLALKACVLLCRQFPAVKSLYLRHGLTQPDWVPAISDIDLTLIIESRLNLTEELAFLRAFWHCYERLKKLFPMLGEVDILDEDYLDSWAKFTIRGYETKNWRLIYGNNTIRGGYRVTSARLSFDALNYSVLCYQTFLLERLHQQAPPSYLTAMEMQRMVTKILHYANYGDGGDPYEYLPTKQVHEKAEMCSRVFAALEENIRRWTPAIASLGCGKGAEECSVNIEQRNLPFTKQACDLRQLIPANEAIESIVEAYNTTLVVLHDGLDAGRIRACLETLTRVFARREPAPLIVSASVFGYMLRFYNPFLYTHVSACGEIAYGKDVLANLRPPQFFFFAHRVLEQTAAILAFPRSRKVISPSHATWFSEREVTSLVERALFAKLYLETGTLKLWHNELLAEARRRYPHYDEMLRALRERGGCSKEETGRSESFRLLKDLATDIHRQLKNSAADENLFCP